MKNSAADYLLYVWPVLPPMLAERIRRHYHVLYGNRFTSANAFAQFWSEFIADDAFRKRIETKARELQPIVFDSQDRSWGLWPIDPEECAGIGFLLGLSLEESLSDYLASLPESRLVRLDQEIADSGPRKAFRTPISAILYRSVTIHHIPTRDWTCKYNSFSARFSRKTATAYDMLDIVSMVAIGPPSSSPG